MKLLQIESIGAEAAEAALKPFFPGLQLGDGEGAVPAAIRRAKRFIEENAARPITSVEIAEAARMWVRGLQTAFRRTVGTSPPATSGRCDCRPPGRR